MECSEHLDAMRDASTELSARVQEQLSELTEDQLTWRPPEGGWGVADCLEHLSITDNGYLDSIETMLKDAARNEAPPAFKPGRLATWFISKLEPGAGGKLKAPKKFKPLEGEPPTGALRRYLDTHERFRAVCETLRGVDLTKNRCRSPVSGLIKFRLGDAMRLMTVHDSRHVAQAERARAHADFPAA